MPPVVCGGSSAMDKLTSLHLHLPFKQYVQYGEPDQLIWISTKALIMNSKWYNLPTPLAFGINTILSYLVLKAN
jgi:hypothetical protein